MAAKRRRKRKYPIEIIGLLLIFISILALGKFGIMGMFFANLMRLFVGETYPILSAFLVFLGGYILLNGSYFRFKSERWLGVILIYISGLMWLHMDLFQPVMNSELNVVAATWRFFLNEFKGISSNQSLGGGMIGASFYSLSYLLFENIGTYIVIGLFVFVGIMSLGNFSYKKFFTQLTKVIKWISEQIVRIFKKLFTWLKAGASKLFQRVKNRKSSGEKSDYKELEDKNEIQSKSENVHPQEEYSLPVEITGGNILTDEEKESLEDESDEEDIEDDIFDSISSMDELWEEENENYQLPTTDLLAPTRAVDQSDEYALIEKNIKLLESTFESFGIDAKVVKANLGPAVTKYEIQPAPGVKVSRIVNLADDIALTLAAKDIRMEAPIPGKALIGIEVPNSEVGIVHFKDVMESLPEESKSNLLEVPIGRDIGGNVATADLTKMPH